MPFDPVTDLNNVEDPLKVRRSDHGKELFEKLAQVANGFSYDDVVNAATNLIMNSIRQAKPTRREAEATFEELAGKTKYQLINGHYDPVTGKRKAVFAHSQVVAPDTIDFRQKI